MDCNEYIESYLSAHADGELTPAEKRHAEEHLAGCAKCRAELESELALKALLRERVAIKTIPPPVEARIRAAIAALPVPGRRRLAMPRRRAWIPIALAAVLLVTLIRSHLINRLPGVPMFTLAVGRLDNLSSGFSPNVPSENLAAVEDAYRTAKMPSALWNFSQSGFRLVGGRLDTLPDGRRVAYTLYRGPFGASILCIMINGVAMPPPEGAVMRTPGHRFYRYHRVSLGLSYGPNGGYTCVLASREPVEHLMKIVTRADAANHPD